MSILWLIPAAIMFALGAGGIIVVCAANPFTDEYEYRTRELAILSGVLFVGSLWLFREVLL